MKLYAATANTKHQANALMRVFAARSSAAIDTHEVPLMKIYAAKGGATGGEPQVKVFAAKSGQTGDGTGKAAKHDGIATGFGRVLVSYIYDETIRFPHRIAKHGADIADLDLILDSGAFSVWTVGKSVDLDTYIGWCHRYRELNASAVPINLDVIPGTPGGKAPSAADRDAAIAGSTANADRIRAAGLPCMEVYHWHEPIEVLHELLDRRQPGVQVGIGGLAGKGSRTDKMTFVDGVFAEVRDRHGWDKLPPLHGLGIAPDTPLGSRYPWWSIDANSWVYPHRFAQPVSRSGKRGQSATDSRTSQGDLASIYLMRVLDRWKRLEGEYTRLWHDRGVRFTDDMAAALA